jgi:hypothetical protein
LVTDSVVAFLEKIPPFQFLPLAELRTLVRSMALEYNCEVASPPRDPYLWSAVLPALCAWYSWLNFVLELLAFSDQGLAGRLAVGIS